MFRNIDKIKNDIVLSVMCQIKRQMSLPNELIHEIMSYLPIDDFAMLLETKNNIMITPSEIKLYYTKLLAHHFPGLSNYDDIANLLDLNHNEPITRQLLYPIISYAVKSNNLDLLLKFIFQILGYKWRIVDEIGAYMHTHIVYAICKYGNTYMYEKIPRVLHRYTPSSMKLLDVYRRAMIVATQHKQNESMRYFMVHYSRSTGTFGEEFMYCRILYYAVIHENEELMEDMRKKAIKSIKNNDTIYCLLEADIVKGTSDDAKNFLKFIKYTEKTGLRCNWEYFISDDLCPHAQNHRIILNVLEQVLRLLRNTRKPSGITQ